MFGLDTDTIRNIKDCFAKIPQIQKVLLYGSRAKGNYKNGSDIDLTLIGKNLNPDDSIYPLQEELNKLYLPYTFDISILSKLDKLEFINHILRVGKTFYQKETNELPAGWQKKKLGDVCDIFNGLWKGKKPPYIVVGVIRNTNFTMEGFLDDTNIAYLPVETKQFEKRKLKFGDIILEKSGGGPKQPVGRVVLFNKKVGNFSFSNFTSVIRIIDSKSLNYNFLHQFLYFQYIFGETKKMQRQSIAIRNLQLNEYRAIQIPIPPLVEQKRIVAALDKTFTAIDKIKNNTEKNLANTKELWQSYLQQSFNNPKKNWQQKKLGDVCDFQNGFGFKNKTFKNEGIPLIRITNIQDNCIDLSNTIFIDPKDYKKDLSKYEIRKGDLLIAMSGATTGKIGIHQSNEVLLLNQRVGKFKPKNKLFKNYLFYYLSTRIKENLSISVGSAIPNLSTKQINNFKIPIPPLTEQKQITERLDYLSQKTTALQETYCKKIQNLIELKNSLLKQAFSGEL